PPMYMPGRLRTGSRPSRTVMSAAVYLDLAIDESARRDPLPSLLPDRRDAPPLYHLESLAGAATYGNVVDGELALTALGGRHHQRRPLRRGQSADDAIVFTPGSHQIDALARTRELRHLIEREAQHLATRGGADHLPTAHGGDRYDGVTFRSPCD